MIRLSSGAGQALAELVVELADADRLARGRSYQRKGLAGPVEVGPGAASVTVAGSREDPYRVTVAVREAGENVRAAASDDVAAAVPAAGDVGFSCDCPDWGDPCKHGVAALLQLAREVDDDPGLLLRWRGIEDVVPPAPPGTGPLIGADVAGDDPVSFDASVGPDAVAERRHRRGAPSTFDPDDEPALDSFGRRRRRQGDRSDGFGLSSDAAFGASEVPEPGDAIREIRSRFGGDLRASGATAEARRAELRRRLGADLVDPADVAAAEIRARAGGAATGGDDGGLLDRFFGYHLAGVIDPPAPLDVVPADPYRHVRVMVETTDAAPVIADALETIADHWVSR